MRKKVFKDTIRIVLGLFTLLWGPVAWAALYPDEDYHHCEFGQDEMSATTCVIIACASLLMFCLVWYATMDKRTANENHLSDEYVMSEGVMAEGRKVLRIYGNKG